MEPYSNQAAVLFKLNSSDDWLQKRQGLALPALPPTTLEARRYFFSKMPVFASLASSNGKGKIDYEAFAQEWNWSANGKDRFYITMDVLAAYAKSWEKTSNIRASQELVSDKMKTIQKTSEIFAALHQPFPSFLTAVPTSVQPSQGIVDLEGFVPPSLSIDLPQSLPCIPQMSASSPPTPASAHHLVEYLPPTQSTSIVVPPSSITHTESQDSMCVINFLQCNRYSQ
jgi:hypothetical protein